MEISPPGIAARGVTRSINGLFVADPFFAAGESGLSDFFHKLI
jgi:hypothetical protein